MAAATYDQPLRVFGPAYTRKLILDSSAAQTVYKGEALIIDQSADTVNVTPCHDATHPVVAPTDAFVGIAAEGKSIALGTAETFEAAGIEAYVEPTVLGFKSAVFTNASIGLGVYMTDSTTLVGVAGVADVPYIGILQFVADGYAFVKLVTQVCTGA